MNTNDSNGNSHDGAPLDASLRLQLRGLRRDLDPAADLWPGIAARIAAAPQPARPAAAPGRGHGASRFAPWALAASLVLTVGVAWKLQPPSLAPEASVPAASAAAQDATALMLNRQAAAMTREYQAALRELEAATPNRTEARAEQPVLRELDHSARQIRTALERDPDARFLLDRLRKTYTLRLELTQRADLS
jgi:hypothetical protein